MSQEAQSIPNERQEIISDIVSKYSQIVSHYPDKVERTREAFFKHLEPPLEARSSLGRLIRIGERFVSDVAAVVPLLEYSFEFGTHSLAKHLVALSDSQSSSEITKLSGDAVNRLLDSWERRTQYEMEVEIHKTYKKGHEPQKPEHLLENMLEFASAFGILEFIESHAKGPLKVFIQKYPKLRQVADVAIAALETKIIDEGIAALERYTASEVARVHPERMQEILERLANNAVNYLSESGHPESAKL